jgi:hypothetical protein
MITTMNRLNPVAGRAHPARPILGTVLLLVVAPAAAHHGIAGLGAAGLLHRSGILIGSTNRWRGGDLLIRVGGVVVAVVGAWFVMLQPPLA